MIMKSKVLLLVVVIALALVGTCAVSFANDRQDYQYVIQESARRNITLISEQAAKDIAAKRIGASNVITKEIELDNEADDYPSQNQNFRPVYSLECIANGQEYDIDIDAVTGEVLKFKLDD